MTPEELKKSIFRSAVSGKLVPQLPGEGRKRSSRATGAEKLPFDIPDTWRVRRLGETAEVGTGQKLIKKDMTGTEVPVYSSSASGEALGYISREDQRVFLKKGDIVVPARGSAIGSITVVGDENAACTLSTLYIKPSTEESAKFLYCFLASSGPELFASHGGAIPQLTASRLENAPVPVPPEKELARIIQKTEALLPLLERFETLYSKLEKLDADFKAAFTKAILSRAAQGRLLPQLEEEGTGGALLRKIRKERPKKYPKIKASEKLFDIPKSWTWVRFPEVADSCLGRLMNTEEKSGFLLRCIRTSDVSWGKIDLENMIMARFPDPMDPRYLVLKNDIVMCESGEPGRCAVWKGIFPAHFQKSLHRIRFSRSLSPYFYYYIFMLYSKNGIFEKLCTGSAIRHLTEQNLKKTVLPLPPRGEQDRIAELLQSIL